MGRVAAESDLYEPVRGFLAAQGFDVHAEVKGCDVVGRRGDDLVVVELKRQLSLDLLAQAVRRQQLTDAVYVAVPSPVRSAGARRVRELHPLLRQLAIGLLQVDDDGTVRLALQPIPAQRRREPRRTRALLRELDGRSTSDNVGGTRGRAQMTAYREATIHVAVALERLGPTTPKALRSLGTGERTLTVLRGNAYGWFERVDRGVYALTIAGERELAQWETMAVRKRALMAEAIASASAT
jgi:hypothetical protein